MGPPTQRPLRFEAAILSRTRSPITSRSNWAKESSTLRVSRPMLEVVLNDYEGHPVFIEQFDQLGEIGERAGEAIDFIDHNDGDLAGPDIGQELLQGRAVEGGSGEAAIIVAIGNQAPPL